MLALSSFMSAFVRFAAPSARVFIILSVKDCLVVMMLRLLAIFLLSVLSSVMAESRLLMTVATLVLEATAQFAPSATDRPVLTSASKPVSVRV